MKKAIVMFLLLFLTFSACIPAQEVNLLLDEKFDTEEYLPDYDMDINLRKGICEHDGRLFFELNDYLYYYDEASGQMGKLCGKPECTHDNTLCNAHMIVSGLSIYDGYIYAAEIISDNLSILVRVNLDGTKKENVQNLPGLTGSNTWVHIHRGYVYSSVERQEVIDGKSQTKFVIYQDVLGGTEEQRKVIYEDSSGWMVEQYQLMNNQLILVMDHYRNKEDIVRQIICYDVKTGKTEKLWSEQAGWPMYMNNYYQDRECVRIVGMLTGEDNSSYTIKTERFDLVSKKLEDGLSLAVDEHRLAAVTEEYLVIYESYLKSADAVYTIMDHEGNLIDESMISVEVPDDGIADDLPICEFWGEYNGKLYFVLESYETVGDNVRRTTISIFAWSAAEGMKLVAQVENTR